MDGSKRDITILITCYNERDTIIPAIRAVSNALQRLKLNWELIVVDDCSRDDSVDVVRGFLQRHPELPIRHNVHARNLGLVESVFEAAEMGSGRYFWVVAGDDNVPEDTCVELLSHVGKADMIIPNVTYRGRPLGRRLLSRVYGAVIRTLSGCPIRYYNGSTVYLRHHLLACRNDHAGINYAPASILRLVSVGATYVEVPVTYTEKRRGRSSAPTAKNLIVVLRFFASLLVRRTQLFHGSFAGSPDFNPEKLD